MASKAAVHSKAMVLLLLIYKLLFVVAPIVCWGAAFGPCFVVQCIVSAGFAQD